MTKNQTNTHKGNILVVDDSPENLYVLVEMLNEHGYKVRLVHSGYQALLVARSTSLDLILLDIFMPEMDGYEICQQLKASAQTRDIPVIFISAMNEALDKVKAFSIGGVDYITKPFQTEEVITRVETHLKLQNLQKRLQKKHKETDITTTANSLKGKRILLVEDNRVNQIMIRRMMENRGLIVDIAYNGKKALAMVAETNFDAVLMDIQMPIMDGYEATQLIRKYPKNDELPVIAMTAHTMSDVPEKCLAVGMNDYVTKPINMKNFFATLEKWVIPKKM